MAHRKSEGLKFYLQMREDTRYRRTSQCFKPMRETSTADVFGDVGVVAVWRGPVNAMSCSHL